MLRNSLHFNHKSVELFFHAFDSFDFFLVGCPVSKPEIIYFMLGFNPERFRSYIVNQSFYLLF